MRDKDILAAGAGYAAWGYLFLYFNINFGSVSILPSFVGFILFYNAIKMLEGLRRELSLLKPLAILLLLWHLAQWLLSWAGIDLGNVWDPLGHIITVTNLYFHFQLLTDFAALARQYLPETPLSNKMLKWRSAQTVILTAVYLMGYSSGFKSGWLQGAALALTCIYLFAAFLLMMELFNLRRQFRNLEYEAEEA